MIRYTKAPIQETDETVFVQSQMSGPPAFNRQQRSMSYQCTTKSHDKSGQAKSEIPFRPTVPVASLTDVPMKRSASSQSAFPSRSFPSPSGQSLPKIQENDALSGVGVDPAEWIAANPIDDTSCVSFWNNYPSPNDIPLPNASACPSLYTGQSVREQATPLTPQTSSFGYNNNANPNWSYNDSIEMTTASMSQGSFASQQMHQEILPFDPEAYTQGRTDVDLFALGAGASITEYEDHGDLPSSLDDNSLTVPTDSAPMARSGSNISIASCKSNVSNLSRRSKERREQVLENGRRTILAPKPQEKPEESPVASSKAARKLKALEARKIASQRRKQAKVYCNHCQEHPGGFRGAHELQRHLNSKHSPTVTKWICRDPAAVGVDTVRPENPLQGCKSCEGNKQYAAYYNAAAHMRRAHFAPKPKEGRTRNKTVLPKEEKRGGSAGGLWPSMDVLKEWMVVVTVKVEDSDPDQPVEQAEDEYEYMDEANDDAEADVDAVSSPMMLDNSPSASTNGGASPSPINGAVADNSYLSSMEASPVTNGAGVLDFAPTLSMNPPFIDATPSDWAAMSSDAYVATYDYTNQAGLPGVF
jgi:hypothetical protein